MIRYKIDISAELEKIGFNSYKAKTSGLLSQDTLKKIKKGETSITLNSLNNLCIILDMSLNDIVDFTISDKEKEERKKILKNKNNT